MIEAKKRGVYMGNKSLPAKQAYDVDALLNFSSNTYSSFHSGLFLKKNDTFDKAMDQLEDLVLEHLKPCTSKKILDLGCGLGVTTKKFVERLKTPIIGVDISQNSIDICNTLQRKAVEEGMLSFFQMDAHKLLFKDEEFDALFSIECLFHLMKELVVPEIYRILVPGGIVSICDYYSKDGWSSRMNPAFSSNIGLKEYENYFRQAGFSEVVLTDISKKTARSFQFFKGRKMSAYVQEDWEVFCNYGSEISGYFHLFAKK